MITNPLIIPQSFPSIKIIIKWTILSKRSLAKCSWRTTTIYLLDQEETHKIKCIITNRLFIITQLIILLEQLHNHKWIMVMVTEITSHKKTPTKIDLKLPLDSLLRIHSHHRILPWLIFIKVLPKIIYMPYTMVLTK